MSRMLRGGKQMINLMDMSIPGMKTHLRLGTKYNKHIYTDAMSKIVKGVGGKQLFNLFDVSLRDGLQALKTPMLMKTKRDMLHNIISRNVKHIEIGSLVSPKILPQMADSVKLFEYSKTIGMDDINYYMLAPNSKYVSKALDIGVENISLITSVSNQFQLKNINKSLEHTKDDIDKSISIISNSKLQVNNLKLYISCVNECPIVGKISPSMIVREILYYAEYDDITNICLSDTCGTLSVDIFEQIMLILLLEGILPSRLSLHLHCNSNEMERVNSILKVCMSHGVTMVDVSFIESGGCSVTMSEEKINRNLSYLDIYDSLK